MSDISEEYLRSSEQGDLWEVFVQGPAGAAHEHAGSVRATDAKLALLNARDVYTRRGNVVSVWVVPSKFVTASAPEEAGAFFDPSNDKAYRHPQFYQVPKGTKNL